MLKSNDKLSSISKILGALFFCLVISIAIYSASVIFIFSAWHCPSGNCQTDSWVNLVVFAILLSPFLIFIAGAYFSWKAVYAITEIKILRLMILLSFALFPILPFAGFVIYAINSN